MQTIRRIALLALFGLAAGPGQLLADGPEVDSPQHGYERNIGAVVRDKRYYKASKIELAVDGGLTPYDSTYDNYFLGGRLTWHISDHYGWEIIDWQHAFSTVTSWTTSLVAANNLTDVQVIKLKEMVGTSFKLSPFYGKIRFFGSQVVFLDIYATLGLGMVNSETHKFTGTGPTETTVSASWDPSLNFGLGFSFYLSNNFTLNFDMRNYMAYSTTYGMRRLNSNFVFTGGLTIFLPGFG
ncbi:outer membrane beta-barrel domain-containing protein [bacterium]|nr:outer membrane beta-barrel domain-containing protein [bacterium]